MVAVMADALSGLSEAQTAAVTAPADRPLAVIAGPGSGKTLVLTRRIARRCLLGEAEPGHVLALTFTRRAGAEMRTRLGRLGVPTGSRRGGVAVGTFHALARAELDRLRAERRKPGVVVLGQPGRL